jgi:hypothetical protein
VNKRALLSSSSRVNRLLDSLVVMAFMAMFAAPLLNATAQTNSAAITNRTDGAATPSPTNTLTPVQQARAYEQATEKIRDDCVQGRRIICGRILKILPEGLVVDSGYTNLMRPPLSKTWLIPGTVLTERATNLVEGREPGCVCVGLVFLTDLPKSRSAKPHRYDYVVVQAYPTGHYTYTSVGTIQRTVRRFSGTLAAAILLNRAAAGIQPPVYARDGK